MMKSKNEKLLELTEMIEKLKKENSILEMKHLRDMHSKDN